LIKCDHALPVAGSIKARGGFYAVLRVAETLALEAGILQDFRDDPRKVLSPEARRLFGGYELTVGSTGNLGLSIGVLGRALGFAVTVHMSAEAKPWKKARLRACGARVVEHASDYTAACLAAREAAERNPRIRFIDDENSRDLFLGYAATVPRLREQLIAHGRAVDGEHPVFIYLPCGVGGAPGGITWAARQVFGDDAHCFTAEPVEAPCMLLGMLTGLHADISVRDIGLDLRTDADGLAVARPSRFVGQMLTSLLSGCYTVTDEQLYRFVADLYDTEGLAVEPSAAAGCAGPEMILGTREGARYLEAHRLSARRLQGATHVVWTTGGSLIPDEQHASFRRRGRAVTL
jgi:D-serine dehydratase